MNDVSPGKLTQLIGAGVVFLFSFFPWMSISGFGNDFSRSAWSSGMFPMATWAPVFALIVGFIAAVQAFKFLELPEKIWEFTLDQITLILSAFTLLVVLSYLITDKGGASIGFGLIIGFLGAIAMIAGFFMDKAGVGVNPNAGQGEIQQPGFPQSGQQPGAPMPPQTPQAGQPTPPAQQAPPAQAAPPQQPSPYEQPAPPQQPSPPQQPDQGTF